MKKLCGNIVFISLCLLWLLRPLAFCDQQEGGESVLGLRECVDLAIKNDPDIINTMDQIRIGRLTEKQAKRDLVLPTVSLETSYGPKLDFFGRPIATENIYSSRASVEKPLYQGGGLINAYRLGREVMKRARLDLVGKQAEVTEKTAGAYYDLLSAQENVRYYGELSGQAAETVALLKEKYAIGAALRVDLLEAEGRRSRADYRLLTAKNDLAEARAVLNRYLGRDPGSTIRVVEEFPVPSIREDVQTLTASALDERPDLLYQKEDVAYNQLKVALSKSKQYPHLSLVGSYSWEGDQFPGEDKEWALMLKLSFSLFDSTLSSSVSRDRLLENDFNFVRNPSTYDNKSLSLRLFDGSSSEVGLEKARADYRLSGNRLAEARRTVVNQVQKAVNQVKEDEAFLETARKWLEYSKEKLKLLEERLQLRETTDLEVLDARTKLADAKVRYLKALYARAADMVRLYRATGKRLQWKETAK